MAEKTRRELLEEAWTENEEKDDVTVVETESEEQLESGAEGTTPDAGGDSDEGKPPVEEAQGKSKPKSEKPKKEVGKKPEATAEEKQEAEAARRDAERGDKQTQQSSAPVTDKAPQSWKPEIREDWAKIPARARAEITRREREIQTTLSQTANIRKFANDFASTVNPFSHLIRAQHSTPLQAVHNLMTTAAGLMTGNDRQKAEIVAEIIQNYAVNCVELDDILTALAAKNGGKIPTRGGSAPQEQIPSWARPLIQQSQQFQQAQTQHEERMREEAAAEIAAVENEPYFDDLSEDIADILEIAARRKIKMTTKQAYDKAVQLRPEIAKLVKRPVTPPTNQNRPNMTRARRAASSISGAPSGKASSRPNSGDEKKSRREMLSEAWDNAED